MIYVECKPDELLARHLTGLPQRQVVHEAKGKGGVCNRLMRSTDQLAMVDEDPGSAQPRYMAQLSLSHESPNAGLKLYYDGTRNNRVVVLRPRLEEWLLRAAADLGLSMRDYGLPERANRLHSVINQDEPKILRLLSDMSDAASPRLLELGRLLTT